MLRRAVRRHAPLALLRRLSRPHVLMWHHGRCGSTVLGDHLGQHPEICWKGEIFFPVENPAESLDFDAVMRNVARSCAPRIAGYEIKGLPCQHPGLMGMPLPRMLEGMARFGLRRAVHLHRRNVLLKLVSAYIVRKKLVPDWHARGGPVAMADRRVRLDVEAVSIVGRTAPLADQIDYIERGAAESLAVLSARFPTLSLTYEDDIAPDPAIAGRRVTDFLGLPPAPSLTRIAKSNTRPLSEVIENLDEVRAALRGTPHAWMADAA
jgi:hypothetical protein